MSRYHSLALTLLLTSCGQFMTRDQIAMKNAQVDEMPVNANATVPVTLPKNISIKSLTSDEVSRQISSTTKPIFDHIHDLDLDYKQKHFDFWIGYFSKKEKERFIRHARNGAKYRSVINQILTSHGLPTDLFYVGLIESGYNTHIRSHASAVGPWQFIKGTATRYGLRVDSQVDERSHIIKATEAAASYFKDLYNIFGSWELALCAYNAGEYRIINAIRKGNTRDYKELVKKKLIPKETIFYIPKVAAARELYEDSKKYGLSLPSRIDSPFEKVKSVKVSSSFDLYKKAKELNVSLSTFKALNPDLRQRWVKVSKRKGQVVFVPTSKHTDFSALKDIDVVRVSSSDSKVKKKVYRVKRGDNLITISKRLGVDVNTLKKINGISGSKIYVGQKLKVHKKAREVASNNATTYRVRPGDNLYHISRMFKLSITELKKMNSLRSSKLYVGQQLLVKAQTSKYRVRRGDNLTKISKKFGVTVGEIKKVNDLDSNIVYSGQVLTILRDEG
ncbi:lytic transglycosylase domain-containing protein [Bacteriovorax sp. Seq25_V]|uniref:lytic transglycosylase domain-containing protein n=1 Tax=Bacteriovorax sp. Seq25_V TaxID=1201288 RepID=UPI00038A17DC|nr:lytic transglycosylase domain-containing protein [Bacteriovorax sp. Seq25_V]EQC45712.1 transglycosylase SLT domain protein [Bacteriovorax sp. Seq25_V]